MNTRRFLLILVLLAGRGLAAEWPLDPAPLTHDPTLLREGDRWWCFSTGPGVRIASSTDRNHWNKEPALFTAELPWWREYAPAKKSLDVWAPDLHVYRGRVWCFYCVSEFGRNNSAIGAMSCSSLAARDWRDEGLVLGSTAGRQAYNAIDPSLTIDADGRPWLVFGSWFDGIQIVALDTDTLKPRAPITALARREGGIEAPNVVHRGGFYYLFVSIGVCCQGVKSTYQIACGRARAITGPYVDREGRALVTGGGTVLESGGDRWKGPGGQDVLLEGDDRWIIARHAYDATNLGKPALRIRDLTWAEDGWPVTLTPGANP